MATVSRDIETRRCDITFQAARDLFLDTISQDERVQFSSCASVEMLIKDVGAFSLFKRDHRRAFRFLERIKKFGDKLQPYFEVCGILVQANSKWTAIAWGAFRLILKLASNFASFFDDLTNMLERLSLMMPRYAEVLDITKGQVSERFCSSLEKLYIDLFDFFRSVSRVFTQKGGRIKRTPVVVGQLFWQPFHVRFEYFSNRLRFHSDTLRDEMSIIQLREIASSSELQADEQRRAEDFRVQSKGFVDMYRKLDARLTQFESDEMHHKIRKWLDSQRSGEIFERALSLRAEGTAVWIQNEDIFLDWMNIADLDLVETAYPPILWINGNPGSGKTVLAASVIQALQQSAATLGNYVCYHFFSYVSLAERSNDTFYRSFLAQILGQCLSNEAIVNMFSFAYNNRAPDRETASNQEMMKLMEAVSKRVRNMYIIIDALDEAEDPDDLVQALLGILQGSNVKLLIFSRPNVSTLRKMSEGVAAWFSSITLRRALVESDLHTYLSRHVINLQVDRLLPEGLSSEDITQHLLSGADGMFMWARLMISYLKSPALVPETRMSLIQGLNTPERLEKMYLRILRLIATQFSAEQELARRIFMWITYGVKDLAAAQLQDIVTPLRPRNSSHGYGEKERSYLETFENFEHTVVMTCASLVERAGPEYQFIHQSAWQLFRHRSQFPNDLSDEDMRVLNRFIPRETEAQSELTRDCLSYLMFRAPAQPLSGDLHKAASTNTINEAFPFLGYASGVWPVHLTETTTAFNERNGVVSESEKLGFQSLTQVIAQFLSKALVLNAWVESTYTFMTEKEVLPQYEKIQKWCRWATAAKGTGNIALQSAFGDVPTELSAFIEDLKVINDLWKCTLHAGPNQIWNDITAFKPSPFLAKTSAISVKSMPTMNFGVPQLSHKPLTTVSAENQDGDRLGVLSIWPNKHFEDKWNKHVTDISPISLEGNEYAGWVARFEIWAIQFDDPRKLKDLRFNLDKDEVKIHAASFFDFVKLKKSSKNPKQERYCSQWALPFPTTISDSLEIVVILRTVYFLDLGRIAGPTVEFRSSNLLQSAIIPISEIPLPEVARDSSRLKANRMGLGKISLSHAYSLQIGRNDQYILWKQVQGLNIAADRRPLATSLAVFQFDRSEAQPRCHFCGLFGGGDTQQCITAVEFHPKLPLVLLHSGSLIRGWAVYLWSFASNACIAFGAQVHDRASEARRGFSDVFISLCTAHRSVEYLNFSTCGTQVIIKYHDQALQDVCSIQSNPVYQVAMEQHSKQRPLNALSTAQETCPNQVRARSENALEKSSSSNELSETFVATHARNVELSTNKSIKEVRIKGRSQREEEVQPLLFLPEVQSADTLRFQVRAPVTREQKIRIVLHKAEQPWNTVSNPADAFFPAVVEKDVRALAPLQKRCFNRKEIEEPQKKRKVLGQAKALT